jgi:hypothetical protein
VRPASRTHLRLAPAGTDERVRPSSRRRSGQACDHDRRRQRSTTATRQRAQELRCHEGQRQPHKQVRSHPVRQVLQGRRGNGVKDLNPTLNNRIEIVGRGNIDFPSIFAAAGGSTRYFVVENDPRFGDPTFNPFEAAQEGFAYLSCTSY